MHSHQPTDYDCPFCHIVDDTNQTRRPEIIYEDELILSLISKHWWPKNPGHVVVISKDHIENIYSLPFAISDRIHRFEKCVATALKKVYLCDGVSSRQHNEPAGNQDVWHYHLHVFPRYVGDNLYTSRKAEASLEDRVEYANRLKNYFSIHPPNLDGP